MITNTMITEQSSIKKPTIKQFPHDFIVNEIMSIDFSQQGEHLWLHIEKTHLNTTFVAKLLANWANIPLKDVGYSGLKDRHAITTQWFSLRLPNKQMPILNFNTFIQQQTLLQENEQLSILKSHWHHKKLNRGAHKANQFTIIVRNITDNPQIIEQKLINIQQCGVPNFFGEQRFGNDNSNLQKAKEWFTTGIINGKRPHPKFDREKISLYLSTARSEIFNAILAKRIALDNWQTPLSGEVFNLNGSQSVFLADVDDAIYKRLSSYDIHLTGAMWGIGDPISHNDVLAIELDVVKNNPDLALLANGLAKQGLKQQRRPLRFIPQQLSWCWLDNHTIKLDFILPSGCFATTVIDYLFS